MHEYIDALIPAALGLFALLAPRSAITKAHGSRGDQAVQRARMIGIVLMLVAALLAVAEHAGS